MLGHLLRASCCRQPLHSAGTALAVLGCCALFAPDASANCNGFATRIARGAAWHHDAGAVRSGAVVLASAMLNEGSDVPPITGLWHVVFTQDGQITDEAFETFTSDGNELMVDTTPPALDNVCNGVWKRIGSKYKIKHPSWLFDGNGNVTGTAIISTELTLSRGGNSFQGTSTIDIYDTAGNLLAELTGEVNGSRITVD
jgi:hypothetical protein